MPLDFKTSDLFEKVSNNFSISDQFSLFKDDILDTMDKQSKVLDFLIDLDGASDIESLHACLDKLPVTLTYQDRLYEFGDHDNYQSIPVYLVQENDKTLVDTLDLSSWEPNQELNFTDSTTNQIIDLKGNLNGYVQDSMASCEVLNAYIDAAAGNLANSNSSVISDFNNAVNGLKGSSSSVDDLISRLSSSTNAAGNSAPGALSVITNVFKNITNTNIDSTGDIQFNNRQYYVQGFAYSHVTSTAVSAASILLSGIVAVLNPVLGFTFGMAGSLLSSVFSASYIAGDTYPTVDDQASNNCFAMPVIQGSDSVSNIRAALNLDAPYYIDYFDLLITTVSDKGKAVTLKGPFYDILVWLSDNDSILNMEVYLDVDLYSSHGLYQLSNGTVADNKLTAGTSFLIGNSEYYRIRPYSMYQWARSAYLTSIGDFPTSYPSPHSTNFLGSINHNIQAILSVCHNGAWVNVDMTRNGNNEQNSAYWFRYCDDILDWDELVNDCIPEIRSHFCGANTFTSAASCLLRDWFDIFDFQPRRFSPAVGSKFLSDIGTWFGSTDNVKGNTPIFYLLDRGNFRVSPPAYSSAAVSRTRWITLGLALATVATVTAVNVVKAKLRPMMAKKYLDVQRKQSQYLEDPNQDSFKDYWQSLKRYNCLATFTGYSKLSKLSGWESGEESSSSTVDIDSVFTRLKTIEGSDSSDDSYSIKAIIDLIH